MMSSIQIISALILGGEYNETEVFGNAVWLWMQSERHKEVPLFMLPTMLLPAIKKQQFILGIRDGQAIFFASWAWMNLESEKKYLTKKSSVALQSADWNSGHRMWFIDWIAPFGDTKALSRFVINDLFPDSCVRSLYQKGDKIGARVKFFRGKRVSILAGKAWQQDNPLALTIN